MTASAVTELLRRHYGLTVTDLHLLPGEVDLNFRVTDVAGRRYCAKISRPGQDPTGVRFQFDLLRHLAAADLPFAVPVPVGDLHVLPDGRLLRLLSWVPGSPLAEALPITRHHRRAWGELTAHLTRALANFTHPDAPDRYRWNPSQTLDCRRLRPYLSTEQRDLADFFWDRFEHRTLPTLADLPVSIVYADAHGDNLLTDADGRLAGLIDVGDAHCTQTVNELAIACAYAGMDLPDPVGAMAEVVAGYRALQPLSDAELLALPDLIAARLLITVTTAAERAVTEPDNAYHQVSAAPAWVVLRQLRAVHPLLLAVRFGYRFAPLPLPKQLHPVIDLEDRRLLRLDLGVGSRQLGGNDNFADLPRFCRHITRTLEDHDADFALGGYGETRPVYTTDDFAAVGNYGPRWRSVHLGLDVWGPAGTPVFAPLPGRVHSCGIDPTTGGYGAVILLEHTLGDRTFCTLYGHLSAASVSQLGGGAQVRAGDKIAEFGGPDENGGWPPHLHFQVLHDPLYHHGDYPGVAFPDEAAAWLTLCPDPHPFLGVPPYPPTPVPSTEDLLERRRTPLGRSLSVSYADPLTILRGHGTYLYDRTGRRYLDTVNNVAHVGHEHPAVVAAIQRQAAVLNTNSRYLHPEITALAAELTATLPDELSVVHFVNSGSEANELALRMCEAWSGNRNVLALEVGYHGNTGRTIDVSGYKFDGKGGKGCPPTTKLLPLPDVFRGRHRNAATAATDYAAYAAPTLAEWTDRGEAVGGFIHESIISCGGQIDPPAGYLPLVYEAVRAAGALCIADEVQTGVGRVGTHWWAFQRQGVVPDIVTIGKPLGNGHPLGAVVCTPAVAEVFANGMEYFNTFGGNPVSCAAGRAVLRAVRNEGLMDNARTTGQHLRTLLLQLADVHPIIGDVRGAGLFLGFELVYPKPAPAAAQTATKAETTEDLLPATRQAAYLKNRMRELGFLMSTDGPAENVLKLKPPLCFTRAHAEQLVGYLDHVLWEDGMRCAP